MNNKDKNIEETDETKTPKSRPVTWRMPVWIAEAHTGDWSEFREVLNEWAESPEELEIEVPEETTSVCMRMPIDTLAALEKEAKRLSKFSKRKWTAGKVARRIYEDRFEPGE